MAETYATGHKRAALCLLATFVCNLFLASASRFREHDISLISNNLKGVPIVDPPKRIAGYFQLDRTYAAEMFYFFFQSRSNPSLSPIVIWMTGGPGCSSELALLYENGPYTLNKAGELEETPYGWDAFHNMIFVDQPIGTGFSYSDDPRDSVYDETGVANDMLDFILAFLEEYEELQGLPIFITGESYAGHYVPAVSHRIWEYNKKREGPYIPLEGLAIGNGLTEPAIQFDAYGDFALQNGLISSTSRAVMSFFYPLCGLASSVCDYTSWSIPCDLGLQYCMVTQFAPILAANPGINVYDIRKKCVGNLCYDFSAADTFMNDPKIRKMLGVGDRVWQACNMDVHEDFSGDWLHRYDDIIPAMMADGVRVMIYAGDVDLICNYLGNRRWVDRLQWPGSFDWLTTPDAPWQVNKENVGQVKQIGPLSFVRVAEAGHMVPMDQPLNGLAMITAWTRNKTLAPKPSHTAAHYAGATSASGRGADAQEAATSVDEFLRRLAGVEERGGPAGRGGAEEVRKAALLRDGERGAKRMKAGLQGPEGKKGGELASPKDSADRGGVRRESGGSSEEAKLRVHKSFSAALFVGKVMEACRGAAQAARGAAHRMVRL